MRIVLQRVSQASVSAGDGDEAVVVGEIGPGCHGLLLLLGIEKADVEDPEDPEGTMHIDWLVRKITALRLFSGEADPGGRMDRSLVDVGGDALVVSQFTLHARLKKGTRPSFDQSAPPEIAEQRYEKFVAALSAALGKPVPTGRFGAMMEVTLVNDGPVTLILDSRRRE